MPNIPCPDTFRDNNEPDRQRQQHFWHSASMPAGHLAHRMEGAALEFHLAHPHRRQLEIIHDHD